MNEAYNLKIFDEICENQDEMKLKALNAAKTFIAHGNHFARYKSKLVLRQDALNRLATTRDSDVETFTGIACEASTQERVKKYLASLKKKK